MTSTSPTKTLEGSRRVNSSWSIGGTRYVIHITNPVSNHQITSSLLMRHKQGTRGVTMTTTNRTYPCHQMKKHNVIKFVCDLRQVCVILGTMVSSTNKTGRHDIPEILLQVALNTINLTLKLRLNTYCDYTTIFMLIQSNLSKSNFFGTRLCVQNRQVFVLYR